MKPRYYQQEAIDSTYDFCIGREGNPIIAMPTGTGKSVVVAGLVDKVISTYPSTRIMVLTHVKELVEQNEAKMKLIWPEAPTGIYSAGLKKKQPTRPIVFAGIGSAIKNLEAFGQRHVLIIDECHLISPKQETMYRKLIDHFKNLYPYLKVIGLTATPYRLGQGRLTEPGGIFTHFSYDITGIKAFNRLIDEGFLCRLLPKPTEAELDTSQVKIVAGEFNQKLLQEAVDKKDVTMKALEEAMMWGHDRHCWLVFASGLEHSEHIAEILMTMGITAEAIHSKKNKDRDRIINDFKEGRIRALVNYKMLTTGFDHPPVDLIVDLYPTTSPGLHVQKYGRGTRPFEGKNNCLVLDFAGNTKRLGPINDPLIPKKKGSKKSESAPPIRICEQCGFYSHASSRVCENCGFEFPKSSKLVSKAGTAELIRTDDAVYEWFNVITVSYQENKKAGSVSSMRVKYRVGLQVYSEYICLEHEGYASKKAREWWRVRSEQEPPETIAEALKVTDSLRVPKKIRVQVNTRYPRVVGVEWR